MAWSSEIACMCNYGLAPSSMPKVLIIYHLRVGNTKLGANAIDEGERAADLDAEVKRK